MLGSINPDWVLSGLTAVYVIATIAICWANWASASAAKTQTAEMQRQYQNANRPRLTIRFDARSTKDRSIVIKNCGHQPAIDVKISLDDDFMRGLLSEFPASPLKSAVHSTILISEGQEFWLLIGDHSLIGELPKTLLNVEVHYKDITGKTYCEKASIDLSQYDFMTWVNPNNNKVWLDGRWLTME